MPNQKGKLSNYVISVCRVYSKKFSLGGTHNFNQRVKGNLQEIFILHIIIKNFRNFLINEG